jgi:ubiquinone/menaquinone biosynthesis C-methylase UbiE
LFLLQVFDARDVPLTGSSTRSFAEAFLAAIELQNLSRVPFRVLDVGTGTARIPIEVCTHRRGIEVTAVDRGAGILQRARRHVARAGLSDAIRTEEVDARALPYSAVSFDAVISNGLVHHVPDRRGVLREMVRVLRPGGLLFVRDSLPQSDAAMIARVLTRSAGGARHGSAFRSRLQKALTIDEARALASAAGLPAEWVQQSGARHWLLAGRLGFVE